MSEMLLREGPVYNLTHLGVLYKDFLLPFIQYRRTIWVILSPVFCAAFYCCQNSLFFSQIRFEFDIFGKYLQIYLAPVLFWSLTGVYVEIIIITTIISFAEDWTNKM